MKRLLIIISLLLLSFGSYGCQKKEVYIPTAADVGGWESTGKGDLTDELKEIFYKGVGEDTNYVPIKLEAKQLVAGTNYMFLCRGDENATLETKYYAIVIFDDLEGNCKLESVDLISNDFVGGYKIVEDGTLNEELMEIWNKANKKGMIKGMEKVPDTAGILNNMTPIILQATQQSAGTNYNFLARANGKGKDQLNDVIIYVDPNGKAYVSEVIYRTNLLD